VPDEALVAYMNHCAQQLGDAYYRTPRHTITGFLNLLAVLEQNPGTDWRHHVGDVQIPVDVDPDLAPLDEATGDGAPAGRHAVRAEVDDDLASFRL
jgi:hypothetical protein